MATYVLVHGAFHGGWCWNEVARLLRKNGHKVEAPDLPGHGKDRTPIGKVTMRACIEKIGSVLDAQSEPAILVGHSMSGVIISQIAEYKPDRIRTLVFLAADMLQNGQTMRYILDLIRPLVNVSSDGSYINVKKELIAGIFYSDCSDEQVTKAKALLGPESTAIFETPLVISKDNFGRVPRVYIECLHDKAVPPTVQKKIYIMFPCQRVISLETGHSPFFSAPKILARHLVALAE
jgi:pimeloyl-ACP methyl ester carboxylesterase